MTEAERLACELDAVPENGADPQLIAEAAAELRRLEAECEQLRADAARYRWLQKNLGHKVSHWFCTDGQCLTADIDAAIAKETK